MTRLLAGALGAACMVAMDGEPLPAQWGGSVALEGQAFPSAWREGLEFGLSFTTRGVVELGGGASRLAIEPFLLLDPAGGRTLFDLPELAWTATWEDWGIEIGSAVVVWGVTESTHLVDVLNQRVPRSTTRGYQRLGQPMVSGTWFTGSGAVEAFLLPGFRERPYAGRAGQVWSELRIDDASSRGEERHGRHAVDWAVRWSYAAGQWDLALSHFSGRSRDPEFDEGRGTDGTPVSRPVYPLVDQTGIELQWTRVGWLVKLEGLARSGGPERYGALAGGVEYALADHLSFFMEYTFDSRGSRATTSLEHDAFVGGRLLTHEAELEAGLYIDPGSGNRIGRAAVRRRLIERLSVALEARCFWGQGAREPPHALRQESFLSLTLRAAF